MSRAILLLSCPDQKGITAAVTDFLFKHGGNILHAAQHTDDHAGYFFMRVEWDLKDFIPPREQIASLFTPLAGVFHMQWTLHFSDRRTRAAVFVSKHLHCLHDLLFRYQSGQLPACDIPLIISNHPDAEVLARQWGIEYLHTPVTSENKPDMEARQLAVLRERGIDLLVLARYHQVLTKEFVGHYPERIINVHHSFLPAFVGGSPYAQAYDKGVKIIGATSHYVIAALDQGPIIEQDTVRIDHSYSVKDLIEEGQDLERRVLYRALRWHLEHRILCYGNKTVVF
jgi:formyltetrahydrofolate deformylase